MGLRCGAAGAEGHTERVGAGGLRLGPGRELRGFQDLECGRGLRATVTLDGGKLTRCAASVTTQHGARVAFEHR